MARQPQRARANRRIDADLSSTMRLHCRSMDLTVVAPAQRHGELIAYFSPACAVLREPQTMGIGGPTAAI